MRSNETLKEMDCVQTNDQQWNGVVPDSFDVRTASPQRSSVPGYIRDQSSFGSCWAFDSSKVFDDRHCTATGDTTLMSVGFLLVFLHGLQRVSARAGVGVVHEHWRRHWKGLHGQRLWNELWAAHGGTLRSSRGAGCRVSCVPKFEVLFAPSLSPCCESSFLTAYSDDKQKASASYSLSTIEGNQHCMMQHGSGTGVFTVFEDFAYGPGVSLCSYMAHSICAAI